jgi:enoyl-CoA hydratase/carnithine racemase
LKDTETHAEPPVLTERHAHVGLLTLNRPASLNALNLETVRLFSATLRAWSRDDSIKAVVVRGAGRSGKTPAFCAGGDIRFQHKAALAQDLDLGRFFDEEYALNHLIHRYPKPYVALMDGIVMGGGMGLSQRASLRIVTEHSTLAMPETKIGLFPDVGGGWFLSRCPGRIGEYLAITGQSINAADAIMSGLADRLVPSSALEALTSALLQAQSADEMDALVDESSIAAGPSQLGAMQPELDQHFGRASMLDIVASLSRSAGPFARQALESIRQNSPLMMSIALEQVRRARSMTFGEELRVERALVHNCFHLRPGASSEAVEGIRALVVDKDRSPQWNPTRLEEVTDQAVQRYFSSPWSDANHPLADL